MSTGSALKKVRPRLSVLILTLTGCVFTMRRTYVGISQYRTPLDYMYTWCIHAVYKWMILTERRRFTTLWSSVMTVDGTLLWTVVRENTNGDPFRAVLKNQHMSKE